MPEMISAPAEVFAARSKSACIGREVDWALRVVDVREEMPGYVRMLFRSRLNDVTYVAAEVPLARYPWLAGMRRGEPAQVRGRIATVGSLSIELAQPRLAQLVDAAG